MSQQRQLFGTDGIRGVAGDFPLTKQSTYLIGRALGHDLMARMPRPRLSLVRIRANRAHGLPTGLRKAWRRLASMFTAPA